MDAQTISSQAPQFDLPTQWALDPQCPYPVKIHKDCYIKIVI